MIERGCEAFLASAVMDNVVDKFVKDVEVVKAFEDVFPKDLSSWPLDREIEFSIDVLPRSSPLSIVAYRMAPVELTKLKKQLIELLEKSFIRPSVSPLGALVLFVRKKDGSMRLCIDYQKLN